MSEHTDAALNGVFEEYPEASRLFEGRVPGDELRITLASGEKLTGSYMTMMHQHFLAVGTTMNGAVHGPFAEGSVTQVVVLRTDAEIKDARFDRQRGEPVPGTLRRDRDGYQARLERLANLLVRTEDYKRKREIGYQFDDVADEIALAQTKRKWIIAIASWYTHSNQEPTKVDMSGGDMSTAEKFQRPRPQDFDPDPKVRRARIPWPEHVRNDPRSTRNMVKALNGAGFKARASVLSEITDDGAGLLVDFPGGKAFGRFWMDGRRNAEGVMEWRLGWDGNRSKADQTRQRRCLARETYQEFLRIVAHGLTVATPKRSEGAEAQCQGLAP